MAGGRFGEDADSLPFLFHAWNRVTGRLDGHDAMLARWETALQSEKILAVNLQPIAVEVYGEFAAVFYVSRETVKVTSGAGNEEGGLPNVVAIRWSDYLVREKAAGFSWATTAYLAHNLSPQTRRVVCRLRSEAVIFR